MARTINKLNMLAVAQAKKPGLHGDGLGLYLLVSEAGTKSRIFRYRVGNRLRNMGLGATHIVTLAEAREKARECRRARHDGIDPIEARRAARAQAKLGSAKAMTFQDCAERYIASHRAGWRSKTNAAQWSSTLGRYVFPVFGSLPAQSIDTGLVMKVIEPIWNEMPETANRVRGRIESVLDWATARGYRTGENPARWRGHLENLLPAKMNVRRVKHYAALPYTEIANFVADLRRRNGVAPRALEFAILTAARTGEVFGATWAEIDFSARLWSIPAGRMKAGRAHRVPLSAPALALLEGRRKAREGDLVFPGGKTQRPFSSAALLLVLRRMNRSDVTPHGFRSTFRDWAAERTGFPREVAEMALAHAVGDAVEAAYRRGDLFEKRRLLMDAWGRFCDTPAIAGEVVELRRGNDQ